MPAEPAGKAVAGEHPSLPNKPAIAVLPFDNLGGDPEQEYFADGIAEDLITELSRIDWLMVISQRSMAGYRGEAVDPQRVAAELGVHYVVTGSVRKAGDTVRVTAHLIDAVDGGEIWADRFDRKLADVFAAQDEIAAAIVGNIDSAAKITEREEARRKRGPLNAWELYQKGLWHFFKTTPEDDKQASECINQAIRMAPDFADAEALLSILKTRALVMGTSAEPAKDVAAALEHAEKAVAADNRSAMAHVAMGRALAFGGDLDAARAEIELAIRLNPSSAAGYLSLAGVLYWSGQSAEALTKIEQAVRLSPKDPLLFALRSLQALCHADLGMLSEAETFARAVERAAPKAVLGKIARAVILVRQQRTEEARAVVAEIRRLRPGYGFSAVATMVARMEPTQRDRFLADLRTAGME